MIRRAVAAAVLLAAVSGSLAPASGAQPSGFDLQAHRGGRGETTEESLRAFAKSLELGVSTLELDVVLTRDGLPLVWHDTSIESVKCADTGPVFAGDPDYPYVGKRVGELDLAQIRTLDCGLPQPEFPHAEVLAGNKIATLPEVFALARHTGVRYNVETKVDGENQQRLVEVILAAARAAGTLGDVEVQSFDWRTLALVRAIEPTVPLVALWERGSDAIDGAVAAGADIVSPDYAVVDRKFVERAHTAGLSVIPWTVNGPAVMRELIAVGVDGIITDYPSRLRTVLAELGMPLPRGYRV